MSPGTLATCFGLFPIIRARYTFLVPPPAVELVGSERNNVSHIAQPIVEFRGALIEVFDFFFGLLWGLVIKGRELLGGCTLRWRRLIPLSCFGYWTRRNITNGHAPSTYHTSDAMYYGRENNLKMQCSKARLSGWMFRQNWGEWYGRISQQDVTSRWEELKLSIPILHSCLEKKIIIAFRTLWKTT